MSNTIMGILYSVSSGNYSLIEKQNISEFQLDLGDYEWELGIDAASKFSGLAFVEKNLNLIVLLDVQRDQRLSKEKYFDDLFYLLKRISKGKKIKLIVNEKPFAKGYARASDVLIALRGRIESAIAMIPELAEAEYQLIYPQSWKSEIINKSKGKNRFNAYGAIAADLIDEFPQLQVYRKYLTTGDLDSFDALGILLGYKRKTFTEDGQRKISAIKGAPCKVFLGYRWEPESVLDGDYARRLFGDAVYVYKPKFLVFNKDYNLMDNIHMAVSSNNFVYTLVPRERMEEFRWRFNLDLSQEDHHLIMFIVKKGAFPYGSLGALKTYLPFNEECEI